MLTLFDFNQFLSNQYSSVAKTIISYFFLIIIMRMMGKRELAQLSIFDFIVFFIISELVSMAINNHDSTIFDAMIPIAVIMLLEYLTAKLVLKYKKLRTIVEGRNSILIYNGEIDQKEMKKQRYNLDDLFSELRNKNVSSPKEVQFAILENNGMLTVIKKNDNKVNYPEPLISDTIINEAGLKKLGKDKEWLLEELKKIGYKSTSKIFLCIYEVGGFYVVPKIDISK